MDVTRQHVEAALSLPPLGDRSDDDLNPSQDRPADAPGRPAAVLCGLVERSEGLSVVLTRRSAHLRRHAGQISFPGGKIDDTDPSPLACALREAWEEVRLPDSQVEVVGSLDQYRTGTGFVVRPFVGFVDPGWQPIPDPGEVAEVFEVPLGFLMNPRNRVRAHRTWQGRQRAYYAIPWGDYYIWGATAGMLKALSDRVVTTLDGTGSAHHAVPEQRAL